MQPTSDKQAAPAVAQVPHWSHSCNAFCVDGLKLWVDTCPHCGMQRAAAPEAPAQADPLEKLTRLQEEIGLYDEAPAQAAPSAGEVERDRKDAERYRWLREQHEADDIKETCCVFAPNDMYECLVPVGSLPGELDAFVDAALSHKEQQP